MRRFFTDQPLTENTRVQLCNKSHHHWVRVLRAKVGDKAVLFNGLGGEFSATLTEITKKYATVQLGAFNPDNRNNPFDTTLALVMSKGERMDYALQKATELGVSEVQLLTSANCEVRLSSERLDKKLASWQAVVASACEQCGLNQVPKVLPPKDIASFSKQATHPLKLVLAPSTSGKANLPLPKALPKAICLLIGAEGGLTTDEVDLVVQQGFLPWCFGARILRTETAPVVALSTLLAYAYKA